MDKEFKTCQKVGGCSRWQYRLSINVCGVYVSYNQVVRHISSNYYGWTHNAGSVWYMEIWRVWNWNSGSIDTCPPYTNTMWYDVWRYLGDPCLPWGIGRYLGGPRYWISGSRWNYWTVQKLYIVYIDEYSICYASFNFTITCSLVFLDQSRQWYIHIKSLASSLEFECAMTLSQCKHSC